MNTNILGVDVGNDYTKTSKGIIFRTTISEYITKSEKAGCNTITWNNKKYVIGNDECYDRNYGQPFNDINDIYLLSLLTAIALSYPDESDISVKLVAGIPIYYFETFGYKYSELIKKLNKQSVVIDGIKKTIIIEDYLSFPQSYIIFNKPVSYKNFETLFIDIGGVFVNLSHWRYVKRLELLREDSFIDGYYEHVVHRVSQILYRNQDIHLLLSRDEVIKIIDEGYVMIYGIRIDVSMEINTILEEYVSLLIRKLEYKFEPKRCKKIILIGGGAISLAKYFKKSYPNLIVDDNFLFSNALTYATIGQNYFQVTISI